MSPENQRIHHTNGHRSPRTGVIVASSLDKDNYTDVKMIPNTAVAVATVRKTDHESLAVLTRHGKTVWKLGLSIVTNNDKSAQERQEESLSG